MLYAKLKNNEAVEYPLSYEQVCERVVDTANKSRFPIDFQFLNEHGYVQVIPQNVPAASPTSIVTMGMPIVSNGVWYENYLIREMTDEEKNNNYEAKSFQIRQSRDSVLRLFVDNINPIRWDEFNDSEKLAWKEYRQALLDVPQQEGFPWNIIWPTQPE
jgi:hypothetical protein